MAPGYHDEEERRGALFAGERPVINEQAYAEAERARRRKSPLARWVARLSALAAITIFAAVVWYAYNWGVGGVPVGGIPVIQAAEGPEKTLPEDRGGLEVRYQDSLVLNGEEAEVERIVPPPEEPLALEGMPEPAAAPESAAAAPDSIEAPDPGREPAEVAQTPEPQAPQDQQLSEADAGTPAEGANADSDPIARIISDAGLSSDGAANTGTAGGAAQSAGTDATADASEAQSASGAGQTQLAQVGQVSGFRVQLASVQDPDAAAREWRRLQGLYPDLLSNLALQTQTVEIEGRGTFHRVQAGPLPSRETAEDLCAALSAQDQPCLVVAP